MNGNPKSGFTLLEMTVVIMVLLSLMGLGLFVSTKYSNWQTGRAASEQLRNVYSAQRLYLSDNPTATVASVTSTKIIPYLTGGATALPVVKSLEGDTLTIKVDVTPPVFLKGTAIYDPSGQSLDSIWDVGQ
jgi:prepilin-type N-terminal cleavage/methylation domain-containing protein